MKTNLKNAIWFATLFFFSQGAALAQVNYDFSTPATLSFGAGGFGIWYTEAVISIDGVSYTLTSGGNGSFSNASGGNGGGASIRKDGAGGDQFFLKRTDGEPFMFYSVWVKHQSISPYAGTPPFYTITYSKAAGGTEAESENGQNTTRTHSKNLAVKSVSIKFNALLYYWIDDIKVGPAVTIAYNISQTNLACNGGATGAASVSNVTGGTEPYSYDWTGTPTGDGTPAITGLTAGSYTCKITDAEGYTTSKTFIVMQPPALHVTTTSTRATALGTQDGTATVNVSGGTPGYTYAWAPSGGTASTASGLGAGTYTCTITDANLCATVKTFFITEPAPPTDITLSASSINENGASGSVVGTLSATDGAGDTHTYALVSGEGDTDNTFFSVSGNKLKIVSAPDYETKNSYHVLVRTIDMDDLSYEKNFTITVNDLDENPVFTSSPETIATVGAKYTYVVQATDPFDRDVTFEFAGELPAWLMFDADASSGIELTGTPGITDMGEFVITLKASNGIQTQDQEFTVGVFSPPTITGFDNLIKVYGDAAFELTDPTSTSPDGGFVFSSQNSDVATINGRTVTVIKPGTTTISVTQEASGYYTSASVSRTLTVEKRPLTITADNKDKIVGTNNPALTYTVSGFADGENSDVFTKQPVVSTLVNNSSELGDYDIMVSGAKADNYAITYEKGTFSVVAGTPSSVSLSQQTLSENQAPGASTGILSSSSLDPNATFVYSLVSGEGDDDNEKFTVSGDQLETVALLNYENQMSYSIRVRTTTQHGFWLEEAFTVTLTDVNEIPTLDEVPNKIVCYTAEEQKIVLSGISSGEEGSAQSTALSLTTDNNTLFKEVEIRESEIVYVLKNGASGTTEITVTVTDDGDRENGGADTFSRSFTVTVNPVPVVSITSNAGTEISKGTELLLTASGGTVYQWTGDQGILDGLNTSGLIVRPAENTTYSVAVIDDNNCMASGEIIIAVKEDYQTLNAINNIMSPNGDGVNDYLVIENIDMYPNNTLHIFDRAGREVYTKASYNGDWDGTFRGTPLAQDTYYYVVDFGPGIKKIKGFVTLTR